MAVAHAGVSGSQACRSVEPDCRHRQTGVRTRCTSLLRPVPQVAALDQNKGQRRSVAAGDLNGDGKLELVVANPSSNTISILLGTGSFGAKNACDFALRMRSWAYL